MRLYPAPGRFESRQKTPHARQSGLAIRSCSSLVSAVEAGDTACAVAVRVCAGFCRGKAEATAAFGSCSIYMEKFIHPARHIEIQVLADEYGNVVCSRRSRLLHTAKGKNSSRSRLRRLLRMSSAPRSSSVSGRRAQDRLSRRRHARVSLRRQEFLLYGDECPASGRAHGDRVAYRHRHCKVADSHRIRRAVRFTQDDVDLRGSSIECRILARQPGKVEFLHVPGGPFVRFDTYLTVGTQITPHYDPLRKLIIYSGSREESLRKIRAALCELCHRRSADKHRRAA